MISPQEVKERQICSDVTVPIFREKVNQGYVLIFQEVYFLHFCV